MARKILIIIHGMGNHTEESFLNEFLTASNKALNRYRKYENTKFEDKVKVIPIAYDFIFEKIREEFRESAEPINKFLEIHPQIFASDSLIKKSINLQNYFGKNNFINTHVLDVLLYLTNVGEWVRSEVANKIAKAIEDNHKNSSINILCHSLGSAVLHDTLSKLMVNDAPDDVASLDPNVIKFNSIWTFSNVSKLMSSYSNQPHPYMSIVKPGDYGCTRFFFNIRHELDPFTRPKMFDPMISDNWVVPYVFNNRFISLITSKISQKNTHSLGGYIEDPEVSIPFFQFMFNFKETKKNIKSGNDKFKTYDDEYLKIQEKYKQIDEFSDLKDFLKLIKEFGETLFESEKEES
ncbi:hypothetical protein [Marinicella marina]|uniref:hypothetical protein n=1 Tax=Marinicella marina TaxID=2996016 RepID=UPI0024BC4019|nr:hypothetical protein [Marinicella marina]MDJ1138812.1 hypothetical protein [Marinicella marina]